jgi:hypothetical protein
LEVALVVWTSRISTHGTEFYGRYMTGPVDREALVERLFSEAASNWGREEAESMRAVIEGIAEAILQVDSFKLESLDEPFRGGED